MESEKVEQGEMSAHLSENMWTLRHMSSLFIFIFVFVCMYNASYALLGVYYLFAAYL